MKLKDFKIGSVIINNITNEKYVVVGKDLDEAIAFSSSVRYTTISLAEFDEIEEMTGTGLPIILTDSVAMTIDIIGNDDADPEWELDTEEVPFNFISIDACIVRKIK
jgi:hypothetical protein